MTVLCCGCHAGVALVIPERGGAGVSMSEGEKLPIPDVLRNGMEKIYIDKAFLDEVEQLKKKVRVFVAHRGGRNFCIGMSPLVVEAGGRRACVPRRECS